MLVCYFIDAQCAIYFFNFTVDVTLGVLVIFIMIQVVEWAANRFDWKDLKVTGEYGDPPDFV